MLERGWRAYGERGVLFAGSTSGTGSPAARAFLAAVDVSYPNGTEPAGEAPSPTGCGASRDVLRRPPGARKRWIGPVTERGLATTLDDLLRSP